MEQPTEGNKNFLVAKKKQGWTKRPTVVSGDPGNKWCAVTGHRGVQRLHCGTTPDG